MFARTGRRGRAHARQAAQILNQYPAQVAAAEVEILIASVENLIRRLALAADPELVRLRKQTEAALARAKTAVAEGGGELRDQAAQLGQRGAAHVREHPWTWIGVVGFCALAIGLWTRRAVAASDR